MLLFDLDLELGAISTAEIAERRANAAWRDWASPPRSAPAVCAAAAGVTAVELGGAGQLPLTRLAVAWYREGGACGRSLLRAMLGALALAGGAELLACRAG